MWPCWCAFAPHPTPTEGNNQPRPPAVQAQPEHIDYIAQGSRIKALIWLTCPNNERPSRPIFSERTRLLCKSQLETSAMPLCWSAGLAVAHKTFHVIQYQPRGKKNQCKHFGCVSISHITWLSYHLKYYRGESCQRENRDQASYQPRI